MLSGPAQPMLEYSDRNPVLLSREFKERRICEQAPQKESRSAIWTILPSRAPVMRPYVPELNDVDGLFNSV